MCLIKLESIHNSGDIVNITYNTTNGILLPLRTPIRISQLVPCLPFSHDTYNTRVFAYSSRNKG